MVKVNTLKNTFLKKIFYLIPAISTLVAPSSAVFARTVTTDATTGTKTIACDENDTECNAVVSPEPGVDFKVNITEVLTVSVTRPDNYASGNIDDFLRNTVGLRVTSNNAAGFIASMTTKTDDTRLLNKYVADTSSSTASIPTLSSNVTRGNFQANYWGYSLKGMTNGDTDAGNSNGIYMPLVGYNAAVPITVMSNTTAGTKTEDIYFGTKADASKTSGTYANTVLISVVSGINTNPTNPTNPDNPVNPPSDPTDPDNPVYNPTNNTTTRTVADGGTTTTQISAGDTRTNPQGVKNVSNNVAAGVMNTGSPLAVGLAITAGVAATAGIAFFIAAKRRKDDDEDE